MTEGEALGTTYLPNGSRSWGGVTVPFGAGSIQRKWWSGLQCLFLWGRWVRDYPRRGWGEGPGRKMTDSSLQVPGPKTLASRIWERVELSMGSCLVPVLEGKGKLFLYLHHFWHQMCGVLFLSLNNVDTKSLELTATPQVKGSVPQDYPHFGHQSQVMGPQVTHTSIRLDCKSGLPTTPF